MSTYTAPPSQYPTSVLSNCNTHEATDRASSPVDKAVGTQWHPSDIHDGVNGSPKQQLIPGRGEHNIKPGYESTSTSPIGSTSSSSNSSPFLPAAPSFMHPTNLFPPFYNRPPTPLPPPSPSLASFFLPRRATTPFPVSSPPSELSPPNSPFASDTEHSLRGHLRNGNTNTNNTPSLCATDSSLAVSSHIAQHTPRASPKVPTYEYYGFVLYVCSSLCFAMYILWSYLPSPMLHALGIHYYPSRWWSLALPSWLVMLFIYIYIALAAYNTGYLTVKLGAVEGVVDGAAQIATVPQQQQGKEGKREWKKYWGKGTDGVIDVPMGGVCEVLYGDDRELEDWDLLEEGWWKRETAEQPSISEGGEGTQDGGLVTGNSPGKGKARKQRKKGKRA